MSIKPSPYQQAVYDAVKLGANSLIVRAVAGSGKTTTSLESLRFLDPTLSVLFLAFNKSIVVELESRVPRGVNVSTFHSAGMKAWLAFTGKRAAVESDKVRKLLRSVLTRREGDLYAGFILKMLGLGKNAGIGSYLLEDTPDNWLALADHHDVELQSEDADIGEAIRLCSRTLAASNRQTGVIDFDDMLYLPLRERAPFRKFDRVFIDEAQDTNGVQRELLHRMLRPGGRLIAVGDESQAIYGFRGADTDAMEAIAREFDCERLPLSISYRCAQAVVREAQAYCPHIEAFEHAEEGTVGTMEAYTADTFLPTDAVLCRNTAPLVSFAYGMIGRGRGVNFLGREIGKGLIALVEKVHAVDVDDLSVKLSAWREKESTRLRESDQEHKIDAINDKVECIEVVIANLPPQSRTIEGVIASIEDLFAPKNGRMVTLATVHKSKGMEWHRVFILERSLMPSKWARQPWQKQQETNLIYVAYTRAKSELYFINVGAWAEKPTAKP